MCDIRIDATKPPEATDSSCGITVVDQTTEPYMTAEWLDGQTGFAQQPVPSFPEKGWLHWASDTIVREYAPSGAYEEEWELLDGSRTGPIKHLTAHDTPTTTNLYVVGNHVMFACERGPDSPVSEFSYGVGSSNAGLDGGVIVATSTLAERVGGRMNLDLDWRAAAT